MVVPLVDVSTGEIGHAKFPASISNKACVNKLWSEGIQAPQTRYSATCTIANAIARCAEIPTKEKENALLDWVCRTHTMPCNSEFNTSDFEFLINEARALLKNYLRNNYAGLCDNPVFRDAMRSACDDELGCRLTQNKGVIDYRMLKRLWIWNAHNAKPCGLGKSAQSVYEALQDIAENNKLIYVEGVPTFSTTQQEVASLSNCSRKTVRIHLKKLIDVGLLVIPPRQSLPIESQQTRWRYYGLPILTYELLKEVVEEIRSM